MVKEGKRKINRENRRDTIIEVAERHFFAKGYEGAGVDDIAQEAGCTKRTLYAYFPGKESLFNAVVLRGYRILNEMTKPLLNTLGTGLDKVLGYGDIYVKFIQDYPQYFKAMTDYETHQKSSPAMELYKDTYEAGEVSISRLVSFINLGVEDKSIRRDIDLWGMAFILYAQIIGIGILWLNKRTYLEEMHAKPWDDLVHEMRRVLISALKG